MILKIQSNISQNSLLYGLGLLVFVPFAYYRGTDPVTTFFGEWLAFFVGLILCGIFFNKQKLISIPAIVLLPVSLALVIVLQIIVNENVVTAYSEVGLLYLLWTAFVMIIAAYVSDVFGFARLAVCLAWGFFSGGVWNVISEIYHVSFFEFLIETHPELYGLGTIGQPNQICVYLFFSCCSLLLLYAREIISLRIFIVSVLFLTAELGFSTSRSGLLYLFACGILIFFCQNQVHFLVFKRLRDGFLLFAIFYLIWQFLYPFLNFTTGAARWLVLSKDNSTLERIFFWKDAWDIFLHAPWLGVGFGEFDWAFFMHGQHHSHAVINNRIEHPHNLFLQLLAEMGIAGFLCFILPFGYWIKGILHRQRNLDFWWHLSLLSVLGIYSLLEYPLWLSNFLGVFAILMGANDQRRYEIHLSKISHYLLCSIPIVGLFLLVNTGLNYLKLEGYYEAVRESRPLPGNSAELVPIANAGLLKPFGVKYFAFVFKLDGEHADERARLNEIALHFEPIPPLAYKQAAYLAYLGKNQEAIDMFRLAVSSYPNELTWFLAQVGTLSQADKDKLAFLFEDYSEQAKKNE